MLEFSIFVQKESHQSFGDLKAGGNQTDMSIPENQNSTINLICIRVCFTQQIF